MPLDTTRANPSLPPDVRDDIEDVKRKTRRTYSSGWTRIDVSASADFTHGLGDFPFLVDVLSATDSQGSGATEAGSITVTKTGKIVTVTNGGAAALFFRVRAM